MLRAVVTSCVPRRMTTLIQSRNCEVIRSKFGLVKIAKFGHLDEHEYFHV